MDVEDYPLEIMYQSSHNTDSQTDLGKMTSITGIIRWLSSDWEDISSSNTRSML